MMVGFFDQLTKTTGKMEASAKEQTAAGEPAEEVDVEVKQAAPDILETNARRTHQRLREATQELLKYGLLEESQKPNLYRVALTHTTDVAAILEPLDLALGLDEVRGLVFITVRQSETSEQDDWTHPLVRRQRLNLEQTLLVAILRQYFIAYEQESGMGAGEALVAMDELIPQLQVYLGDLGSDAKERTRVIQLLDQLKGHGLVSSLDAHERVTIRPIIAHLANPENLQALLAWLREQSETVDGANEEPGEE